jgi:NAD(P)-dependent dehydrogenase (short-subunit alcohol dehydrogenase family)
MKVILQAHVCAYSAEEMAGTAVYLASKAGGYVSGQEIIIDGGYLAVNPSRA